MKKLVLIQGILLILLVMSVPMIVEAVSYPVLEEHRLIRTKAVFSSGSTLYLFESGTPDVKQGISVNDVLTVYRMNDDNRLFEVGKIKVLSFVGDFYIKGQVTTGEIRHDDIAKKGNVSCLVILLDREPK
ncbi:MAG TPA: hypothetical protein VL197_11915 [Nitrospirota bacterium]|nr:hypothetical protein [Nitrospirota bacterium]